MKGTLLVLVVASVLLVLVLVQLAAFRGPTSNLVAVASSGSVAVISDLGCSQSVNAVSWGVLSPCGVKNVVVYVRNDGASPRVLVLSAMNWTPDDADSCLGFS